MNINELFDKLLVHLEEDQTGFYPDDVKFLHLLLQDAWLITEINDLKYKISILQSNSKKKQFFVKNITKIIKNIINRHNLSQRWIRTLADLLISEKLTPPEDPIEIKSVNNVLQILIKEQMSPKRISQLIYERKELINYYQNKMSKTPHTKQTIKDMKNYRKLLNLSNVYKKEKEIPRELVGYTKNNDLTAINKAKNNYIKYLNSNFILTNKQIFEDIIVPVLKNKISLLKK